MNKSKDALLQVRNLHLSFNTYAGVVRAIRGVSFDLYQGENLAIVGESGSGKTVTSKTILRLFKPPLVTIGAESEIIYDGKNVLTMTDKEILNFRGKEVSMIFQDPMTSLDPTMKIGKQISEIILTHTKISKKEAWQQAIELLRDVGIPHPEDRVNDYPHQLSGGMRQRVVISMALSCRPRILIADEPTTALDVTIQAQILDLISETKKMTSTSVILVTHDLGVVANFADRVAVMYAGQIVEVGSTDEIFYQPSHPYTRALLDSIPKSQLDKNEGDLYSLSGSPPDLIKDIGHCAFSDRCKYRMPICQERMPDRFLISGSLDAADEHSSRCWLQHSMAPLVDEINAGRDKNE